MNETAGWRDEGLKEEKNKVGETRYLCVRALSDDEPATNPRKERVLSRIRSCHLNAADNGSLSDAFSKLL